MTQHIRRSSVRRAEHLTMGAKHFVLKLTAGQGMAQGLLQHVVANIIRSIVVPSGSSCMTVADQSWSTNTVMKDDGCASGCRVQLRGVIETHERRLHQIRCRPMCSIRFWIRSIVSDHWMTPARFAALTCRPRLRATSSCRMRRVQERLLLLRHRRALGRAVEGRLGQETQNGQHRAGLWCAWRTAVRTDGAVHG